MATVTSMRATVEAEVLHHHRLQRQEEQREHRRVSRSFIGAPSGLSTRSGRRAGPRGRGASTSTSSTRVKSTAGRMPASRNIPLVWRCTAGHPPHHQPGRIDAVGAGGDHRVTLLQVLARAGGSRAAAPAPRRRRPRRRARASAARARPAGSSGRRGAARRPRCGRAQHLAHHAVRRHHRHARRTPSASPRSMRTREAVRVRVDAQHPRRDLAPGVRFLVVDEQPQPLVLRTRLGSPTTSSRSCAFSAWSCPISRCTRRSETYCCHAFTTPSIHATARAAPARSRERETIDDVGLAHAATRAEKHPQRMREEDAHQEWLAVTPDE